MLIPFEAKCAFVVVSALLTSMWLAPILWDAAGYIEDILNNLNNLEYYR